jgi:hypothetical protein
MACPAAEEWRPVAGFGGSYEVSSLGQVRSLSRVVLLKDGRTRRLEGRTLRPGSVRGEHQYVTLQHGGEKRSVYVHRLVVLAFMQAEISPGMEVCHCDGNPKNNRVSNLRVDTHKSNVQDTVAHGTHNRGSRNGMSKLSPSQVIDIFQSSSSVVSIAKEYGIDKSTVSKIRRGERWGHLTRGLQ